MSSSRSFSIKVCCVSWNLTSPGHWGGILRKLCAFQNFSTILLCYLAKTCKINWLKEKPVHQLVTARIFRGGLESYSSFFIIICVYPQSCPALCHPGDCSPLGSSVHGISQARILGWVAISFSRGIFPTQDPTSISCIGKQIPPLCHLGSP